MLAINEGDPVRDRTGAIWIYLGQSGDVRYFARRVSDTHAEWEEQRGAGRLGFVPQPVSEDRENPRKAAAEKRAKQIAESKRGSVALDNYGRTWIRVSATCEDGNATWVSEEPQWREVPPQHIFATFNALGVGGSEGFFLCVNETSRLDAALDDLFGPVQKGEE